MSTKTRRPSKPRNTPSPEHPSLTPLMRSIQILSFLLSLLCVAVQHVAASFASSILYPNASSVWYRDYTHNVTWCVFQGYDGER